MDNFQFWLYVIVGAVYVLSRFMKKSGQANSDSQPGEPSGGDRTVVEQDKTGQSSPKALTFEELLREISASKGDEVKPHSPPVQKYIDYDDNLEEEAEDLEDTNYDYRKKDKVYAAYEAEKRQAFARPSLEDTMKLSDTDVKFGRFSAFETEETNNVITNFLGDLKDPEGLKKAVVMSEILNRKF